MSDASPIYRSALGYELVMRALYGRNYTKRMQVVAEEVPEGSSVVELCCGPGTLYQRYLRPRTSAYVGLDVNERFVERLRAHGVDARRVDLGEDAEPLPAADVALMQASLYHFLPNPEPIIEKMLAAARDRVIVSEPIRNLSSSGNPLLGRVGRRASDPGAGGTGGGAAGDQRFNEESLDALMERYGERVLRRFLIPGGREKVYVLRAA